MRYAEIIAEDVTRKELILYHGTKSAPFDTFAPASAAKGKTFWNPLGDGMYASDAEAFSKNFGPNVHEVVIPPGSTFKRINMNAWQSVGTNIIKRALRLAMKQCGESFDAWERGVPWKPDFNVKKMTDDEMVEKIISLRLEHMWMTKEQAADIRERAKTASREVILNTLTSTIEGMPRIKDEKKADAIREFEVQSYRQLRRDSPYESLCEIEALVQMHFGEAIGEAFYKALPVVSNAVFKKYDFIVFTETNDIFGHGKNGNSALEVVIFNPELQKTRAQQKFSAWNSAEYNDPHNKYAA